MPPPAGRQLDHGAPADVGTPRAERGEGPEELLREFGPRYATAVRSAVLILVSVIALVRAAEYLPQTCVAVLIANAWNALYCWRILRAPTRRLIVLDILVICGLCLAIPAIGAVEQANSGWIRLFASFSCIAYQWYTDLPTGTVATLATVGTLTAVVLATGLADSAVNAASVIVAYTAASRAAWEMVRRAARTADRLAAEAGARRRAYLVAVAVGQEERALVNSLHDTAAATLLMVASGQVRPDATWLPDRAQRDLDILRPCGSVPAEDVDLVHLLDAEAARCDVPVTLYLPTRLTLPHRVAHGLVGAVREALNNITLHATADTASVRLIGDRSGLVLEVADDGVGFTPSAIPATARGVRESIEARMVGIQGEATIVTAPGHGTVVG